MDEEIQEKYISKLIHKLYKLFKLNDILASKGMIKFDKVYSKYLFNHKCIEITLYKPKKLNNKYNTGVLVFITDHYFEELLYSHIFYDLYEKSK